ncbi:MAG: helix-turn-helix domain-containing protein [Candidatus Njordarchaeota archaeon]
MRWGRRLQEFFPVINFLSAISGPRWIILKIIGGTEKSTSEIYEELISKYNLSMPRSVLYYHLGELERIGIIEVKGYKETGKGGAPEKIWVLKVRKIVIDIVSGAISIE